MGGHSEVWIPTLPFSVCGYQRFILLKLAGFCTEGLVSIIDYVKQTVCYPLIAGLFSVFKRYFILSCKTGGQTRPDIFNQTLHHHTQGQAKDRRLMRSAVLVAAGIQPPSPKSSWPSHLPPQTKWAGNDAKHPSVLLIWLYCGFVCISKRWIRQIKQDCWKKNNKDIFFLSRTNKNTHACALRMQSAVTSPEGRPCQINNETRLNGIIIRN